MARRVKKAPAAGIRGIHFDLKGTPPTPRRLIGLLDVIKAAGYNALLVEWEDMFPWTVDERFRSETAYSDRQVAKFTAEAAARGLEVIPLVQSLGHMETPLSLPEYARLREIEWRSDSLNPLAPGASDLVISMVDDVLRLLPETRYFHLGGDESWTFGRAEETATFIKKNGKAALYLKHIEPVLDHLGRRGVRPILWSDMMHDWPAADQKKVARKADLCPWGYDRHPDVWEHHSGTRWIERFAKNGVTLWGATAYKGATQYNADLCDYAQQEENALGWVEVAARFGMKGLFATGWSRHSTHRAQTQPIDGCLDSLVNVGLILSEGAAPGRERCLNVLDELGERKRYDACEAACRELSEARRRGWIQVQRVREQITALTDDPRRRGSGMSVRFLVDLRRHLEVGASKAAADFRKAFKGLMDPIWIERYLTERIEPLLEEAAVLDCRARVLEPDAYRATIDTERWTGG